MNPKKTLYIVITSYSIHYTKLYDFFQKNPGFVEGPGGIHIRDTFRQLVRQYLQRQLMQPDQDIYLAYLFYQFVLQVPELV